MSGSEMLLEFPHPKGTDVFFPWGVNRSTGKTRWRQGKIVEKKGHRYHIDAGGRALYIVPANSIKLALSPDDEFMSERPPASRGFYGLPKRR